MVEVWTPVAVVDGKYEGALISALPTADLLELAAQPRQNRSVTRHVDFEMRRRARRADKRRAATRARRSRTAV